MPWKTNEEAIASIPALKALPAAAVSLFRQVANKQFEKGDAEGTAMKIAWGVVKQRFKRVGDSWVARTDAFVETNYYVFRAEPAESFITRTLDGQEIHNYVLTDMWPDDFGTAPTEEIMQEWASWCNRKQPEGDVDHEIFDQARNAYGGDPEKVAKIVEEKKGIGKIVKAVAEKGKLMVSVAFDKRYVNHIEKIKGLSIEAAAVKDNLTGKFKKARLFGFTFAVNQKPGNPRAVRVQ